MCDLKKIIFSINFENVMLNFLCSILKNYNIVKGLMVLPKRGLNRTKVEGLIPAGKYTREINNK